MFDLLMGTDLSGIVGPLSKILDAEVGKMTLAFMIAAYLHRGWVKKDMEAQFGRLTEAINNVAVALSQRMDGLDRRVEKLEQHIVNNKDLTPKE